MIDQNEIWIIENEVLKYYLKSTKNFSYAIPSIFVLNSLFTTNQSIKSYPANANVFWYYILDNHIFNIQTNQKLNEYMLCLLIFCWKINQKKKSNISKMEYFILTKCNLILKTINIVSCYILI